MSTTQKKQERNRTVKEQSFYILFKLSWHQSKLGCHELMIPVILRATIKKISQQSITNEI